MGEDIQSWVTLTNLRTFGRCRISSSSGVSGFWVLNLFLGVNGFSLVWYSSCREMAA